MKENYHNKMLIQIEKIIENYEKTRLLLHSCCAPCSSYVIEFLSKYFDIEVFFFNPNIYPENEYVRRLNEQIKLIKTMEFDYFTTTLTISPMKNAEIINNIGLELAHKYNIKFLNSDFKKNNGYKCSVELSKKYNLYRQNYCGCIFSQQEYINKNKS